MNPGIMPAIMTSLLRSSKIKSKNYPQVLDQPMKAKRCRPLATKSAATTHSNPKGR